MRTHSNDLIASWRPCLQMRSRSEAFEVRTLTQEFWGDTIQLITGLTKEKFGSRKMSFYRFLSALPWPQPRHKGLFKTGRSEEASLICWGSLNFENSVARKSRGGCFPSTTMSLQGGLLACVRERACGGLLSGCFLMLCNKQASDVLATRWRKGGSL